MLSTGITGQELRLYAGMSISVGLMWLSETTAKEVWPQVELLLLFGAIGLLAFLIRGLRALPKDRARPPIALSVAAAVVPAVAVVMFVRLVAPTVAQAVDNLALHDRTIGDLTIALPSGNETTETGETSTLRIHQAGGLDLSVSLLWSPGELAPEGAQHLADGIAGQLNAPRPIALPDDAMKVGIGVPQRSFRIDAATPVLLTVFACGDHVFAVLVTGPGAPGVAPRILASVHCDPLPALPAPPTLDSPPGASRPDGTH